MFCIRFISEILMAASTISKLYTQISEMEDALARLCNGATTVMAISAAHNRSDIGWCGERMLEHAEAAHVQLQQIFALAAALESDKTSVPTLRSNNPPKKLKRENQPGIRLAFNNGRTG
jgi:hypothetical protein